MDKIYIGIDNGVTGSIGIIGGIQTFMFSTPTITQQSYTKKKQNITRLNVKAFREILQTYAEWANNSGGKVRQFAVIERPMVNPMRFTATVSAVRCLEAQLVVLESLNIPYMYIDSREWQKALLPQGCKKEELKKASHDIGVRLFPGLKEMIDKLKDADGILIAEYARRQNL